MPAFRNKSISRNAPHVFASTEEAYIRIRKDRRSQSVVVSGESGAGKTETNKYMMRYLAWRAENLGTKKAATVKLSALAEPILKTNPLLEAFGNAKTVRNNNSSRFGRWIEVHFDNGGAIASARIEQYLLEKSRVPFQVSRLQKHEEFRMRLEALPV